MSEMSYMPFKPGMSIKSGDAVFVFVEGVTPETFEKDEEFRSGTVTTVVAGKVRVRWDSPITPKMSEEFVLYGNDYVYVEKGRLTRIEKNTWVLDLKSEIA